MAPCFAHFQTKEWKDLILKKITRIQSPQRKHDSTTTAISKSYPKRYMAITTHITRESI